MASAAEMESLVATLIGDGSSFQKMMADAIVQANQTTKALEKSTDQISKNAKEANEVFGQTIDNLGTKMSNMAGQMRAMAAIESPWGILTEGVGLAAEAERMETAFGTMLKSADKGKKMMEDLTKFAAETPLEMAGLASTTKTLLQFGVAGDQVITTLRMLGDVAGGEQDKLSRLAIAFGQARAAGRLMGEEAAQMREAGFNPLSEIARTTGKSVAQLTDEMSKGKISVEMMEAAFKSATSEGGAFFEGMKSASKTASGLWSTMQDDINGAKRELGNLVIEQLRLKDVMIAVSGVAQGVTAWLKSLDNWERNLITTTALLVFGFGALVTAWKVGAIAVGMIIGVLKDMLITFGAVKAAIVGHIASINLATAYYWLFNAAVVAANVALKAFVVIAVVSALAEFTLWATNSGDAVRTLNAELDRSIGLHKALADITARRDTTEISAIMGISDPAERAKELQKALDLAEKNAKGMKDGLESAKRELEEMSTTGSRVLRSSWVPFIGREAAVIHETLKEDIKAATDRVEKHAEKVAKLREELGKATEAAGKPDPAMVKAITELNLKLEEAAATAGKSAHEIELYKLRRLKATDADLAATRSLMEMADAAKKVAELHRAIGSLVDGLALEIETMGMSSDEAKLYKLAREGATEADLANARGLLAMKKEMGDHNELMKEGRSVVEKYKPEAEKVSDEIAQLTFLLSEGAITAEEFDLIMAEMGKKMDKTGDSAMHARKEVEKLDAALAGGADARARILEYTTSLRLGRVGTTVGIPAGPNQGQAAVVNRLDIVAGLLKDIRDKPGADIEEAAIA